MKRKDSKIKKVGSTILVASAILTSANSKAQVGDVHIEEDDSNSSKQEINKEKTFPIIKKDSLELETRLKEIAKEPYNGKLAMGAMCYIGGVFKKEDTICPICNEKMPLTWWEEKDLPKIISIVNQIKQAGYDVVLDCDHSPKKIGHIFNEEIITDKDYWNRFAKRDYITNTCVMCNEVNKCDCGCRETANIVYKDFYALDACLN